MKSVICFMILFLANQFAFARGPELFQIRSICEQGGHGCVKITSGQNSQELWVKNDSILTDLDIKKLAADYSGQPRLLMTLTKSGAHKLEEIVRSNMNQKVAIIYEGKLLAVPVIPESLKNNQLEIPGPMSSEQARDIEHKFKLSAVSAAD